MKYVPFIKACRFSLGCTLLAVLLLTLGNARAEEVVVLRGSSIQIPVPEGVKKITVTNPSLVEARPGDDGKSVLVNGLTEGVTDVRIERVQGGELIQRINVRADLQRVAEEIKELLGDVEGLDVKVLANKVVLKGDIVTKKGYDRVHQVATAYAGAVLNMTEFDQTAIESLVEKAIIGDIGGDTVRARVMKDTVILEGVLYSEADVLRALQLAKLRMPNVVNLLQVQNVMVETDVQFVQVTTDDTLDFGHNILDSLQIGGTAGIGGSRNGKPSLSYGVNASANAAIKALVGKGDARVLAQPHLSTESGGEGRFQSGGEIFFQVAGNVGGSLEKVNFGVILTVKPSMLGQNRILNDVSIEVSLPSAKQQGNFSLDKFETHSKVICKAGESIVLSGLIQSLASRFKEKTPLLGDIPLLNAFFSTKTTSREKKELVVLITPTPVFPQGGAPSRPISAQTQELLIDTNAK